MKVLIICSRRDFFPYTGFMAPFIYEQMKELTDLGIECEPYLVSGGAKGYFRAISEIRKKIKSFSPDVLHAHYGLCGLVANFQRSVPVVTTYHGSDLNNSLLRMFSFWSIKLSKANIIVSKRLSQRALSKERCSIIPCGVNSGFFTPMDKELAREKLGWKTNETKILFSKEFFNKEKNYPLAKAAVDRYKELYSKGKTVELIEFIGYSRKQVQWLYNAVDCVIMTSHHEGSPQFIKEAMACNCPIVSVDVGDVKHVISGVDGCFLAERTPEDIAEKLDMAINQGKTNGREKVLLEYDSKVIAKKVAKVYEAIIGHE